MEQVCKHYQTGYCKFGEHCRKHHVNIICKKENCNSKDCIERHPKICKYFTVGNACKFDDSCSYLHVKRNENSDISELTNKVNQLESMIINMSLQIKSLTEELEVVKTETEISTTIETSSEKILKCEHCDYTANTSTVLKRHVTRKHKIVDKEKDLEMAEALFCPPPPVATSESTTTFPEAVTTVTSPEPVKEAVKRIHCNECDKTFNSNDVMCFHIVKGHLPPPPCESCHKTTVWLNSRLQADLSQLHYYACYACSGNFSCCLHSSTVT